MVASPKPQRMEALTRAVTRVMSPMATRSSSAKRSAASPKAVRKAADPVRTEAPRPIRPPKKREHPGPAWLPFVFLPEHQ